MTAARARVHHSQAPARRACVRSLWCRLLFPAKIDKLRGMRVGSLFELFKSSGTILLQYTHYNASLQDLVMKRTVLTLH